MNDHDDIFEAQLRSLKPLAPSPRVKQAVADHLEFRKHATWRAAGIISAIAAAILLAVGVWVASRPQSPQSSPPIVETLQPQVDEPRFDTPASQVTAWHYREAARQSPELLIRLLDQQAANTPGIGGPTPSLAQLLESES